MSDTDRPTLSFADLATRFAATVDAVPAQGWDAPSPCAEWTAAEVVDHVVTTQRDFLAQHGHPIPGAETAAGNDTATDPAAAWHRHASRVTALLATPGVAETAFEGAFGATTVGAALAEFYGFDLVVHRWDVARAAGIDAGLDDDELDLVETNIQSWGDHLYMDGICARPVDVADTASRADRLMARTGRDPAA